MQQLILAEVQAPLRSLNVGLTHQLDSPFNLFVNLEQLLDPSHRNIHLFIYSMGKQMIAGWGLYDRQDRTFELDGYCKYLLPQLYPMTQYWRRQNYRYAGNTVTDRPSRIISAYLDLPVVDYQEYQRWKHLLAWFDREITEAELERAYPGLLEQLPEDELDLLEYIEELRGRAQHYEQSINLKTLSPELLRQLAPQLQSTLLELFDRFANYVAQHSLDARQVETCPDLDFCQINRNSGGCEVYFSYLSDDFR